MKNLIEMMKETINKKEYNKLYRCTKLLSYFLINYGNKLILDPTVNTFNGNIQ